MTALEAASMLPADLNKQWCAGTDTENTLSAAGCLAHVLDGTGIDSHGFMTSDRLPPPGRELWEELGARPRTRRTRTASRTHRLPPTRQAPPGGALRRPRLGEHPEQAPPRPLRAAQREEVDQGGLGPAALCAAPDQRLGRARAAALLLFIRRGLDQALLRHAGRRRRVHARLQRRREARARTPKGASTDACGG